MKKIFSAILVIALLCTMMTPICFAAENENYWSVITGTKHADVNAETGANVYNGTAYITLYCQPNDASVNFIRATSYIDKNNNGQWTRMELENGDTEWVNYASSSSMNLSVQQKLTAGKGEYRITTEYAIYYIGVGYEYVTVSCTVNYA